MTLTCNANGLPEPTFTWITPDGEAINATTSVYEIEILDDDSQDKRGKILQNDGSLLIFNTRVRDGGIYKCVAINVMGQDEGSVNFTVRKGKISGDGPICHLKTIYTLACTQPDQLMKLLVNDNRY